MPTVAKLLLLANGASMFFIIVYMHLFRGLYYGSYIEPREYIWSSGVIILLLMMGTAFTGYVLPWGQMSFSGATVITSMLSILPKGQIIVEWLWGGKFQNPWNLLQQLVSFSTTHPQYSYFYLEHCGLLECTNHKGDGALDVPQWSSHPVSDGAQCPAKSLVGAVDRLLENLDPCRHTTDHPNPFVALHMEDPTTDLHLVKQAYRKLFLLYHPDFYSE